MDVLSICLGVLILAPFCYCQCSYNVILRNINSNSLDWGSNSLSGTKNLSDDAFTDFSVGNQYFTLSNTDLLTMAYQIVGSTTTFQNFFDVYQGNDIVFSSLPVLSNVPNTCLGGFCQVNVKALNTDSNYLWSDTNKGVIYINGVERPELDVKEAGDNVSFSIDPKDSLEFLRPSNFGKGMSISFTMFDGTNTTTLYNLVSNSNAPTTAPFYNICQYPSRKLMMNTISNIVVPQSRIYLATLLPVGTPFGSRPSVAVKYFIQCTGGQKQVFYIGRVSLSFDSPEMFQLPSYLFGECEIYVISLYKGVNLFNPSVTQKFLLKYLLLFSSAPLIVSMLVPFSVTISATGISNMVQVQLSCGGIWSQTWPSVQLNHPTTLTINSPVPPSSKCILSTLMNSEIFINAETTVLTATSPSPVAPITQEQIKEMTRLFYIPPSTLI